jgi:hypothetical protein
MVRYNYIMTKHRIRVENKWSRFYRTIVYLKMIALKFFRLRDSRIAEKRKLWLVRTVQTGYRRYVKRFLGNTIEARIVTRIRHAITYSTDSTL